MSTPRPSNTGGTFAKSANLETPLFSNPVPLDTIRVSIPKHCIRSVDLARLKEQPYTLGDKIELAHDDWKRSGVSWVAHKGSNLPKGIKLKYSEGCILLDFSAKILGDRYLEGLTLETIEQAFRVYQDSGIVQFTSIQEAVAHSQVCRVDSCYHIAIPPSIVIASLSGLPFKGYLQLLYPSTLAFNPTAKNTGKPRLQVYSKAEDMKHKDRKLWETIKGTPLGDFCQNTTRVELQMQSLESVRKFCKLTKEEAPKGSPVLLLSVLKSKSNPVSMFVNELFRGMKLTDTVKRFVQTPKTIDDLESTLEAIKYRYLLECMGGGTVEGLALAMANLEGSYDKKNRLKNKAKGYFIGQAMSSPILEDVSRQELIDTIKIALEEPCQVPIL